MKRSTLMLTALVIAGLAIGASQATADVIALYNFGPDEANPSFASADLDPVTTASDLSDAVLAGSKHEIVSDDFDKGVPESPDPSAWPVFRMSSDNFNTNSSFGDDTGRYVSFSITASGGQVTAWDSLTFDWARSDATEYNAQLLTSTEDTDGTFAQVGAETGFGPADADTWVVAPAIDLSALPTLSSGDTRYFRLQFAADSGNLGGARSLGIDDVMVNATPVPEPATMSLLALGGLGVLLKRKRKA